MLAEGVCCIGSQFIYCCGQALQCSGSFGYPIFVFFATLLSLVYRFYLVNHMDSFYDKVAYSGPCHSITDDNARHACYGNQFVYRLSFALVVFFSLMMVLVGCCRRAAHDGSWLLKIFVVVGVFIASCWMPDDAMASFSSVCLVGAAIFVVIQILALLDWVYGWNEHWRSLAEEDPSYFHNLLWSTVLGYLLSVLFIVLSIVQFAASGCDFAIAEVTTTCVACFVFSILSIVGLADHSSLLCSSMVTLYVSYYCWSVLTGMSPDITNDDGDACNTLLSRDGSAATAVNVAMGIVLTCAGLAYSAYSLGTGLGDNTLRVTNARATSGTYAELDAEEGEGEELDFGGSELVKPLMSYHFIMVVCTMFMTMTIVNWDTSMPSDLHDDATLQQFGTGLAVVLSKTIAQWLTIVLYVWTIIAQPCLALCGIEREF